MVTLFKELLQHQAHADASLLVAIRQHEVASKDQELRRLLHHVLVARRFWLHLCRGLPFSVDAENVVPATLEEIIIGYRETHMQDNAWLQRLEESDLVRTVESPYLPNREISVKDALMQVCLHSHGHRAQCAMRLRMLGGEPPTLDYIVWLKNRPDPIWA
jgi:uncharacterized damage-inducible protein DinB